MRCGPAKISHDTIAEVLGDMAAESSDRLGRGAMVARNHRTPFFGVELSSDFGRAYKIAEQYRQMPPLAAGRYRSGVISAAGAAGAASPRAVPHSPQNLSSGWIGAPHFAQAATKSVPQLVQNLRPCRLSLPHFEQRIYPYPGAMVLSGKVEVVSKPFVDGF